MINIEIYLTIGLLSLLVILSVFYKSFAKKIDRKSFSGIITGLFILAVMQLFKSVFIIDRIADPILNIAPLYLDLFYLSNSILGLIVLMKNVSVWLPLSQKHRALNSNNLQQMELFKKVQQLIRVENRPEQLLQKILREICLVYPVKNSAIYVCQPDSISYQLVAVQTNDSTTIYYPAVLEISSGVNLDEDHLAMLILKKIPGQFLLPIQSDSNLLGLLICESSAVTADEKVNLKLIADIIGRYLDKISLTRQANQDDMVKDVIKKIKQLGNTIETSYFKNVFHQLHSMINIDYLSLITKNSNDTMTIQTVTSSGSLKLKNQKVTDLRNPVAYSFETGVDVIINNIVAETDFYPDNNLLKADYNSMVTLPVEENFNIQAVLLVAGKEKNLFSKIELKLLNEFIDCLPENIIHSDGNKFSPNETASHPLIEQLKVITSKISDKSVFCQTSIDLIANNFNFDLIRFSDIDTTGQFLDSQAISGCNSSKTTTPEKGAMVLSLLPEHRQVFKTGQALVTNQNSSALSISEMNQLYGPKFEEMILLPLSTDGVVTSIISLVDIDNSIISGLCEKDFALLKEAAGIINLGYNIHRAYEVDVKNQIEMSERYKRIYIKDIDGVKASLTGLLGSVELLKNGKHKSNSYKLLNIVDRSARRLNETLGVNS